MQTARPPQNSHLITICLNLLLLLLRWVQWSNYNKDLSDAFQATLACLSKIQIKLNLSLACALQRYFSATFPKSWFFLKHGTAQKPANLWHWADFFNKLQVGLRALANLWVQFLRMIWSIRKLSEGIVGARKPFAHLQEIGPIDFTKYGFQKNQTCSEQKSRRVAISQTRLQLTTIIAILLWYTWSMRYSCFHFQYLPPDNEFPWQIFLSKYVAFWKWRHEYQPWNCLMRGQLYSAPLRVTSIHWQVPLTLSEAQGEEPCSEISQGFPEKERGINKLSCERLHLWH